jgi:hypothetical protein
VTSFSTTKALLSAECVAETYEMRGYPCSGHDNVGKCLRSTKACGYWFPQPNFVEPLSMVKKGRLHSATFDINKYIDDIQPVSFWMSFMFYGGCIWAMALILSGFALIPFAETKQPRTLPFVAPNIQYSGLSFSLALRIFMKVSAELEM